MSDIEEQLRELVEVADPNGTVTVRWLAELLGEDLEETSNSPRATWARDLTVEEVAERFGRAPSTVRGWLNREELRGYKLNGRDWRIPPAAVEECERRQRSQRIPGTDDVDITEWRNDVAS